MHWASSAKRGVLVVKESLDTGSPDVHVLLDVSRPAYDDEPCFEEAVEAAASALVAAVKAGFGARLTAGDGTVNWGGDVRHVLDHMAGLAAAAAGPSPARLVGALPRVRDGAILLLVTGGITDEDLAALHHAAPRYRRTGALVLHAADTESTTDAEGVALIAASRAARVCARWNALGAAS
ncbi:DUF58 domain-containing protein [Actinomadura madurae]|nr:DUF58 domain-containing protein [Actinomadura madurae]